MCWDFSVGDSFDWEFFLVVGSMGKLEVEEFRVSRRWLGTFVF